MKEKGGTTGTKQREREREREKEKMSSKKEKAKKPPLLTLFVCVFVHFPFPWTLASLSSCINFVNSLSKEKLLITTTVHTIQPQRLTLMVGH